MFSAVETFLERLQEFSKSESCILFTLRLLTYMRLRQVTSFLFAAHLTKLLLLSLPWCDTSSVT